jgi:hypothetical protein
VQCASHTHGLFCDDNAEVYYKLKEATRSTPYADSIKPYQQAKNGRAAFLALSGQYAGQDKWEAEIKKQDMLLHTRKWKGQANYTLERFIQSHRNAFVSMQACAQHVQYQLPNEHTRVGYLLDAIENDDAGLQAAMAAINEDMAAGGKRNDFERAAAYLLPKDPVVKKRMLATKRANAQISEVTAGEISAFGTKPSIGKTGVHFRYYKPEEYDGLSKEQKEELREWRRKQNKDGKGNKKNTPTPKKKARFEKAIASAVDKKVAAVLAKREEDEAKDKAPLVLDGNDEQARAYIMSLFKSKSPTAKRVTVAAVETPKAAPSEAPKATTPKKVALQSILRRTGSKEE